jgi:phosphatidylinositol alpha-1,6-mannosyltransferase
MGAMLRTLIVTNDFPPRQGGIQSFVHELARRLPPDRLTVYAPKWDGDAAFDAAAQFEVIRHPTSLMIGGPAVTRRAVAIARQRDAGAVVFGAAAPLGLITPALRRAGITRAVAITHGHEAGWAALPGARALLRRIGEETDVVTYLGEYFRVRLSRALTPQAAARMTRLHPGVDAARFRPDPEAGAAIRERYGLTGRPVVVCVSRLVRRKGQDTLLAAWPRVLRQVPDASLLLVGDGPRSAALRELSERMRLTPSVRFTGPVPAAELPAHYAAGDVFAMPCRTRRGGLDVEGLGIWRRRPPGCRWSAATRAAPRMRSSRGRPATWYQAATAPRWPNAWSRCCPTRPRRARWAKRAAPGWSATGPGPSPPPASALSSSSP